MQELDPLGINQIVTRLHMQVVAVHGIEIATSVDFDRFATVRAQLRDDAISPYFDPQHNGPELSQSAFWIEGRKDGEPVYVEAYRLYEPNGPFNHWCRAWLMDAHTRAGEDVHIETVSEPMSEPVSRLGGRMAYRGELFMSPALRGGPKSRLINDISLLHHALVWGYWKPDYIWGLTTENRAQRGMLRRIYYNHLEEGFVVWKRRPVCVEQDRETLCYQPRHQITRDLAAVSLSHQTSTGTS